MQKIRMSGEHHTGELVGREFHTTSGAVFYLLPEEIARVKA